MPVVQDHKYVTAVVMSFDYIQSLQFPNQPQAQPHSSTIILGTSRLTMLYSSSK